MRELTSFVDEYRASPKMGLKPIHLVVTLLANAKSALPAAGGLTRCYVARINRVVTGGIA